MILRTFSYDRSSVRKSAGSRSIRSPLNFTFIWDHLPIVFRNLIDAQIVRVAAFGQHDLAGRHLLTQQFKMFVRRFAPKFVIIIRNERIICLLYTSPSPRDS